MDDDLRLRIAQLEDIIAQYRATQQSLRARLTELENRVGKVPAEEAGCLVELQLQK